MNPTTHNTRAQDRDAFATANDNALMRLLAEYDITLPPRHALAWRPTRRTVGSLPGFERELEILCTDGVVAWYLQRDGQLFYGHTQYFTGDIQPLHGAAKEKSSGGTPKVRKPSKRALTLKAALDALR
jgi:hypothetical protein